MNSGWDALAAAVEEARALVTAASPTPEIAAEGEAYVTRMVASSLGGAVLGHLFREGGLALALPVQGGPNPDYVIRHCGIDPSVRHRLEGRMNGSERIGIGLYRLGDNGAPLLVAHTAILRGDCDDDGSFHLDLAPADDRSPGLAMPAEACLLMVRILHRDDSVPAQVAVHGVPDPPGPMLATGSNDGALGLVAHMVRANTAEYMKWVRAACDLANRFGEAPEELAETVSGDAETQYFLGGFDLGPDECLEVTFLAPTDGYWSLHAYNYWYEHLQTPGVHDRNAVVDADGRVRIAVGPSLPDGAPNRIDTIGRRRGAFVCRVIGHGARAGCPTTRLRPRGDPADLPVPSSENLDLNAENH